jgi:hypothetical protein
MTAESVARSRSSNTASPSRGAIAPEWCINLSPKKTEGVGNAGRPMHPQPRVQMKKAHERSHHRSTGKTRHSRTRMVLTVSFVLSPACEF